MKKWIKQIREGKGKEERDVVGVEEVNENEAEEENIATLYEVVEDYLKSLDHNQLMGITEQFVDRYKRHTDEISDIIKVSPRVAIPEMARARVRAHDEVGGGGVKERVEDVRKEIGGAKGEARGDDNVNNFLKEWMEEVRVQDNRRFEMTLNHLAENSAAEIRRLEDILELKIKRIESDLSTASDHQMGLVAMLQNEVHEQNRRLFSVFNRVWILITGVVVAFLVGGAALLVAILK